ncbi:tetratricopeptide repeat protein [Treponema sp.]|uniref:tetratricopeptide repeat protein n=1 Tax=Treponema sp. TaxID=166 RepID=UPI003F0B4069
MGRSNLDTAKHLIKRRKFDLAISILESNEDLYDGDFEYYLALGIAYLYADVPGKASQNFRNAREIKIRNTQLLLGQAAIFLRHGETDRALEYYLDVLDINPGNSVALAAMEFIRLYGDYTTICKWVDTGDIKKFYPPIGTNPDIIRNCVFAGLLAGLVCSILIVNEPWKNIKPVLTEFESKFSLSVEERKNPLQTNISPENFLLKLNASEVSSSFNSAKKYFGEGRDNAAQVELNRILNSNAAESIKSKSLEMSRLLKEPSFSSLKDNYSYSDVMENPLLYQNCYVIWDGSSVNESENSDGSWSCMLLVNYIPSEKKLTSVGSVKVVFEVPPKPPVDQEKPVRFLAQVKIENGELYLLGRGIYQPLRGKTLEK